MVVVWEPPLEGACPIDGYSIYYREVMSHGIKSKWHSVTVNRNATSYMLHLNCNKDYDVAITSWSGYEESNLSKSKTLRGDIYDTMVLSNPLVARVNVPQISFTQCDTTVLLMTSHMASHKRGNVSKFTENKVLAQILMATGLMVLAGGSLIIITVGNFAFEKNLRTLSVK